MAAGDTEPRSSNEWIGIYNREFHNIGRSYRGSVSNDAKIGHALNAVEAILKAVIWKHNKWNSFPNNRGKTSYLYHHNLEKMLKNSGVEEQILNDPDLSASWRTLTNANARQLRYKIKQPADKETHEVVRSARDIHTGIGPWLLKHYHGRN